MRTQGLVGVIVSSVFVLAGCSLGSNPTSDAQAPEAGEIQVQDTQLEEAQPAVPGSTGSTAWIAHDCALVGPGVTAETPADQVGAGIAVRENQSGSAPEVLIDSALTSTPSLQIIDVAVGTGARVKAEDVLDFHYCGVGLETGTIFDSSWARDETLVYPLNQLIMGWQEGLIGMQAGGQRVLVIPGELAYGEFPPPGIEPNESLLFVIDLVGRA